MSRCSSRLGTAESSAHLVLLLFRQAKIFHENLPKKVDMPLKKPNVLMTSDHSNRQVTFATHHLPSLLDLDFRGCPRGVTVKAMHCGIVVREFVLQSRYYVHFRANSLGKGMNPLILPPAMGK